MRRRDPARGSDSRAGRELDRCGQDKRTIAAIADGSGASASAPMLQGSNSGAWRRRRRSRGAARGRGDRGDLRQRRRRSGSRRAAARAARRWSRSRSQHAVARERVPAGRRDVRRGPKESVSISVRAARGGSARACATRTPARSKAVSELVIGDPQTGGRAEPDQQHIDLRRSVPSAFPRARSVSQGARPLRSRRRRSVRGAAP